jgi:hypothetical protein
LVRDRARVKFEGLVAGGGRLPIAMVVGIAIHIVLNREVTVG